MLDLTFSIIGLIFAMPIFIVLTITCFFSTGSPIFRQRRLGLNQTSFILFKFRTMNLNTPSIATHLVSPFAVTPFGLFIRKTKLDELPQLLNVLKGDMSIVGPRPGLPNQILLTKARERLKVFAVRPGITGLSQIKNIDMSTPQLIAETDARMISNISIANYFKYIFLTIVGKGQGDHINVQ